MNRFVDTNILVRLLAQDEPKQLKEVTRQINLHASDELIILDGVLVELFFVLEYNSLYHFKRTLIIELFQKLVIDTPQFHLSETALAAFELFEQHPKLDFMDCLLATSANQKANKLITFDKELLKTLR